MTQQHSLLDLIGNTPIAKLTQFDIGPCELFVKLETNNPGGSIKDRPALFMIEAAEKQGLLKAGGTIIEATAGNTGLGLAVVAAAKGYKLILVIPDKMSQEKIFHLKAAGAEIIITRSDVTKGHPDYYQDKALALSKTTPGAYYINQFGNPNNVAAHYQTTGPEILQQLDGKVDAVVCGVGTGATLTGIGRYMRENSPHTEMVLADPEGSILAPYIQDGSMHQAGSWLIEGIGEDFIPEICDISLAKKAYAISDKESFTVARELLRKEGILAGSSTGTLLAAALRYCREQTTPKRVITLICDSGNKYLSKMYNDFWMVDNGFITREHFSDLRDLIARRHWQGETITVKPSDPLTSAYALMKMYDVSQLPVMDAGKIVGIIDESDLLIAVANNEKNFRNPIKDSMSKKLEVITAEKKVEDLLPIFAKGHVALVMRQDQFLGLITQIDLLNYLRRKLNNH